MKITGILGIISLREHSVYLLGIFLGFSMLAFSIVFTYLIPKEPLYRSHSNIKNTIIALELADSKDHIYGLIGGPEDERHMEYIDRFKKSVYYDGFFIIIYAAFLALMFHTAKLKSDTFFLIQIVFYLGLIATVIFDYMENNKIISVLSSRSDEMALMRLQYLREISLTKWTSFYLSISIIGILFWMNQSAILLRIAGVFLSPVFFISLFSFQNLSAVENSLILSTLGMFIVFVYYLLKAIDFYWKKINPRP